MSTSVPPADEPEHLPPPADDPEPPPGRSLRTLELDDELLVDIRGLIREDVRSSLQSILINLHAADIADLLQNLGPEDRLYVFGLLGQETAADVLVELEDAAREELLAALPADGITRMVGAMESDDAADVIADLEADVADRVLGTMEAEDAANVQRLLQYPEDSAGGIMATEVLVVTTTETVAAAIRRVREFARGGRPLYDLYVTDPDGVLKGFLPVSDLILLGPGRRMGKVLRPVISVRAALDQEEVAQLMRKHDLVSVPVVNDLDRLVGAITVDDIVDVLEEEATEDIERMAGLTGSEESSTSVLQTSRIRLPWLLLGFAGELLSALVLRTFQASLETIIAAAFFIPIVMAMGGNAGIQSSAIVVRGLATGDVRLGQIGRRILKECGVALLNGLILGILVLAVAVVWLGDLRLGVTLGLSLLVVVINATIVGAAVPFLLERLSIDPAIATGPFITTTNDALGLLIYFGFMTLLYT